MPVSSTLPALDVRPLIESRPPAVGWEPMPIVAVPPDQPALDLTGTDPHRSRSRSSGVRVSRVRARWTARPRADLPDAGEWSAALVVALVQALLAQRPIAQLNRWLADDVLAVVSRSSRRRRSGPTCTVVPVVLRSVRVQHPHPEVAEVAAQVSVGTEPTTLALRLEALGDRWLCTALELDRRALR